MSTDTNEGMKRADALANRIIDLINEATRSGHPADGITALQWAVAAVSVTFGIPPELFMHRVIVSMARIINGSIPTREVSRG